MSLTTALTLVLLLIAFVVTIPAGPPFSSSEFPWGEDGRA